ncbi:hypothetical protein SAMN05444277_106152 [Parafilimonas terrae]|uniref:Uncharacterized protein n=2 Tax=Parafilimonas terrae TaxID=1465490 RepID=A0A1I5WFH4_9BACT|nr:hypothetical protein SAMN05444277_106152 [Parafilimonas terrae]
MNARGIHTSCEYVLLMTACIKPKNLNRSSFRATPHIRFEDYKKAFEYWLNYSDKRIKAIVFAENSGYELIELKKIANKKNIYKRNIEFLQFEETERLPGVHYGYSDMEIIDYAIYNSKLITSNSIIIKTTGRLYFPQLNKLLDLQDKKQYDFFSDARDFSFWKLEKHYVVTTLFIMKTSFYKQHLFDIKRELAENTASHMETLYFKTLKPLRQSNRIQLGFPFLISTIGIGAHSNSDYASFKKRIEAIGLFILRRILPAS